MKMGETEFGVFLQLLRMFEEQELRDETIPRTITSIIKEFDSRLTDEQKKELAKQFPHLFKTEKSIITKDVPMYDYY